MNKSEKKFLFELLSAPSPTGFETEGQKVWVKHMKKYAQSVNNDSYGTAWATDGTDPHISVVSPNEGNSR